MAVSEAPMHVVIAVFDTPDGASSMLKALDAANSVGLGVWVTGES